MKTMRFVPLTAIVASLVFACSALAQGQFSQAQAQAIINTLDWNRLLAYGKAWAQAEPNNATAWYVIGHAYGSKFYNVGLGQPAEAADAYRRAVQLNPKWVEAWNALGLMEQEIGQWRDSVTALERATQLAPDRTSYWDFLCGSYMHTHQFQQAGEAADNLEKYAKTAKDWFQAGTCYYGVAPYYQPTLMYQKSKTATTQASPRISKRA